MQTKKQFSSGNEYVAISAFTLAHTSQPPPTPVIQLVWQLGTKIASMTCVLVPEILARLLRRPV